MDKPELKNALALRGTLSITRPQGGSWDDQISIQVRDEHSRARFLEIKIDAKELMLALTGLCEVPMSFDVHGLDKVGKHVISKNLTVQMPAGSLYKERDKIAYKLAQKACEGTIWIPSTYFGSKSSFFTRDGVDYAQTDARAYLNDEEFEAHKAGRFATDGKV